MGVGTHSGGKARQQEQQVASEETAESETQRGIRCEGAAAEQNRTVQVCNKTKGDTSAYKEH